MLGGSNIYVSIIDDMSSDDIAELDNSKLREFQVDIDNNEALWERRKATLQAALDKKFGDTAAAARLAENKDTGTINLIDDGYTIKCELTKRVEWDQEKLATINQQIARGGGDPAAYMVTEYKIREATYSDWHPAVKEVFNIARTVKPQKPKYTVTHPELDRKGRK